MDASAPLDWDDLQLVLAIADTGGMAGAAERLGIDQSTVFRRLGRLEGSLGTPLFERHRTGYAPTVAGEEIARIARRIADEVAGFTRRLAGRELKPAGELRVTTSDALLVHLLMPMLARFRRQCPDLRLDIVVANQALNLSRRDADVALRATDRPPEELVGRRLGRVAWALYEAAAGPPVPAPPLEREWVAPGEALGALGAARHARAHLATDRIACRIGTVLGLAEAVESGIGIGHLPCFVADVRPALRRLAPPDPALAEDLWLLTHPDLRRSPRVRVFLDFMAEELAAARPRIEGTAA